MSTGVIILLCVVVAVSIGIAVIWFYVAKHTNSDTDGELVPDSEIDGTVISPPSFEESQGEQNTFELQPFFNKGDWIVAKYDSSQVLHIIDILNKSYLCDYAGIPFAEQDRYRLWTIEDAKAGDVLAGYDDEYIEPWIGMFKCKRPDYPNQFESYCFIPAITEHYDKQEFIADYRCVGHTSYIVEPATKEQQELLFKMMNDAGYEFDYDKLELRKIVQPVENEEKQSVAFFDKIIEYFSDVVPISKESKTYGYLFEIFYRWYYGEFDGLYQRENFPTPFIFEGNVNFVHSYEVCFAWLVGMVLGELVPQKRDLIYRMAYEYKNDGSSLALYGWSFETDPTLHRIMAAFIWAVTDNEDKVPELMNELGGKPLKYVYNIDECFVDISFMPPAAGPYLKEYSERPNGYPADANSLYGYNLTEDVDIHGYVSKYFSLDTNDEEKRQQTIQAIANKEYKLPHLFGKPRTVTDKKYGTMSFNPVFGLHNIGIEIPEDGEIAKLCYEVGMASTNNRKSLLDEEYGRRRPGEGDKDGTANNYPNQRVLVNFAIEDGDGHRTGYYDKNGDYVDDAGNHIGDYVEFYQNAVYANSYPSGHSAYIIGVALVLAKLMPEKAHLILRAMNWFAISRVICRYHWMSDTMIGRLIGCLMAPIMVTMDKYKDMFAKANAECEALINGTYVPKEEKVNESLSYVCGGYGSCHVDAGEKSLNHYCNKECDHERHPFIIVSQCVEFTIEGAGVKTIDGKTSGTWEAGINYELVCPAVAEGEEKVAKITMRNDKGVRILNYKLSRQGTKDEGVK